MRFFGGLSVDEIAEVTTVAPRTVDRQWRAARAWLSLELSSGRDAGVT
jgi:DNA-directed RNA polymerase specialized sigma24 family protein